MKVITTIPPYAPFIGEAAGHPIISGVRINTVMPRKEPLEVMLGRIREQVKGKEVWVDLKCRQIRTLHAKYYNEPTGIRTYTIGGTTVVLDPASPRTFGAIRTPPWAALKISHKITLDLSRGPVRCHMNDGFDTAQIVEVVDGDSLIMLDGPKKLVGDGESINILDPSLEIHGYFTDLDREYIDAAKATGIHTYMLSYVETDDDITSLLALDPQAVIMAKIESPKGLAWVKQDYPKLKANGIAVNLMAARGDLYVEVGRPDKIIKALRTIITADPAAVVASRILTSLLKSPRPTCSDITDVACLLQMGYPHLMIGDDVCFDRDLLLLALDMLAAIDRNVRDSA